MQQLAPISTNPKLSTHTCSPNQLKSPILKCQAYLIFILGFKTYINIIKVSDRIFNKSFIIND